MYSQLALKACLCLFGKNGHETLTGYFSIMCQNTDKNKLRQEKFILVYSLRMQAIMMAKVQQ